MSEVCQAPQIDERGFGPYFCSLPKGHDGEHVAKGASGKVFVKWDTDE